MVKRELIDESKCPCFGKIVKYRYIDIHISIAHLVKKKGKAQTCKIREDWREITVVKIKRNH